MKFRVWFSLARGVVLESVRRKDMWVVAILGMIIMCASGALGFFGFEGLEAFAKDLAVTVLGLFSTILAVITACRQVPDELRNRTLYPLLARPISRFDLLAGKLLGAIAVSWIAFLLLVALTGVALAVFGVQFEAIVLQYIVGKMLGLAVLCSVTLTLSIWMTPQAAATLSFVLAFGSSMIVRALVLAAASSPTLVPVFKFVNWIVPQYGLFDLGSRVANTGWSLVPLWAMAALAGYALVYGGAMLSLGYARFRSRPL